MKNTSFKKIQKTIEKNRSQLVEIEKEINKICQIQNEIDKREKEINKKLSAVNAEIKGIFSYYDEIPFSVKIDLLTSKQTRITKNIWDKYIKAQVDAFLYEIKPFKKELKKIKSIYDNLKAEEGKQTKNLLKLYDKKDIIEQNIENLENTLVDKLSENELKILELF